MYWTEFGNEESILLCKNPLSGFLYTKTRRGDQEKRETILTSFGHFSGDVVGIPTGESKPKRPIYRGSSIFYFPL